MREFEKVILLRAIDSKWIDHIDAMDQLRTRNSLTCICANRSTTENTRVKGLQCLRIWFFPLKNDAARYAMKAEIRNNLEREEVAKGQAVNPGEDEQVKKTTGASNSEVLDETNHARVEAEKSLNSATVETNRQKN